MAETAKLLGIETELDGLPAEGLGGLTIGVSPLEMASAYATLASGGIRHEPQAIESVEFPNGDVEKFGDSEGKRVLTDGEAYEVTRILQENISSGTGTGADIGCSSGQAGKTGTTDDFKDAWFVGYTPALVDFGVGRLPGRRATDRDCGRTGAGLDLELVHVRREPELRIVPGALHAGGADRSRQRLRVLRNGGADHGLDRDRARRPPPRRRRSR